MASGRLTSGRPTPSAASTAWPPTATAWASSPRGSTRRGCPSSPAAATGRQSAGRDHRRQAAFDRAVVGEYQPHTTRKPRRQDAKDEAGAGQEAPPRGEGDRRLLPGGPHGTGVVRGPRTALAGRRGQVGRLPTNHVNVFTGLLHGALDGGTLQMVDKGKKGSGRSLVPYKGYQGVGGEGHVVPFSTFEWGILSCLREIDPAEVLPAEDGGTAKTEVLTGRLLELEGEVEKVKRRLAARYSDALADVLERHEDEQKALAEQMREAAQQEAASPLKTAWGVCMTLLEAIEASPTPTRRGCGCGRCCAASSRESGACSSAASGAGWRPCK